MLQQYNQSTITTTEFELPQSLYTYNIINVILGSLSILTNSLILTFIACDRKLRHISSNIVLSSLLVVGAIFGVLLVTFYGWFFTPATYQYPSCVILTIIYQSLLLNYNLHMILISADKYLRVAYPIRYPNILSTPKLITAIIILWILAFTLVGGIYSRMITNHICFVDRSTYTTILATVLVVITIFLPLVCIIFLYIAIMCLVYSRAKLVITIMPHVKQANIRRNKKAIQQMAIIIGIFSLCWLPYTIAYMIKLQYQSTVTLDTLSAFKALLYTHIAVNPVVYYCYTLSLRKEGVRVWRRSIRRVRVSSKIKTTKIHPVK